MSASPSMLVSPLVAVVGPAARVTPSSAPGVLSRIPGGQSAPRVLPVLGHELFKETFGREQKRADRHDHCVALLLIGSDGPPINETTDWSAVVEAIARFGLETAIVGWVEPLRLLGIILPDLSGSELALTSEIEASIRSELEWRLDSRTTAGVSIRLHVYSPPGSRPVAEGSEDALIGVPRPRSHRATAHDVAKRALDIVGSAVMLVLLSPVFLLIAILVNLRSPGPVFYRQVRIGQRGKPFTMLKFRTMRVDADHALHQQYVTEFIKSSQQWQKAGETEVFKLTNDPRVTRIGRMLRRTSLDELPQFWNVLRGEMSLVGPRPPLAYEIEQYRPWHWRRVLEAKPGITGLWQVVGRSRTTFDEMVRLDIRYVTTRSLWTDLKILFATPRAVVSGKGAC